VTEEVDMSSRRAGEVQRPAGHQISDHLCWIYDGGRKGWAAAAVAFLSDGAARGERLLYIADDDRSGLLADLSGLDDRNRLLTTGQLTVLPLHEVNGPTGHVDRAPHVSAVHRWTHEAATAGHPALRVAANPSWMIRDGGNVTDFAGFELLFDEMVATSPMIAMCGYDRRLLPADAIAQMCFVHPLRHGPSAAAPGGLHADGAGGWNLTGPLDFTSAEPLAVALSALPSSGDVHLHLDRVRFCDAAATRVLLARAAAVHPYGRLILHSVQPLFRQVLGIGWPGDKPGLALAPTQR
jgi:hypothetical protein